MSYADTITEIAKPAAVGASFVKKRVANSTLQSLVVSAHQGRRDMLSRSANDAGWNAVVCADTQNAFTAVQREAFQLALIDLESFGCGADPEFKEVVQRIAELPNVLVVICGNEGDGLEEIWARQFGVWLYLPGVTEDCDIASLCEQARPVAEKFTDTVATRVA